MKRTLMTLSVVMMFMATSCSTIQQQVKHEEQYTQARMLDISASAHVRPLTVEIEIDKSVGRIKETWSYTKEDVIAMGGDLSNIRANGLYKTAQKHNADIIVAPLFDLRTEDGDTYRLTVIGYPGNFVNWKSLEAKDSTWMRLNKFYKEQYIPRNNNVDIITNQSQIR